MTAMPSDHFEAALVWFRRDLRADDHAALALALRRARKVWCCFVFDTKILGPLPRVDRRVEFIFGAVQALDGELAALAGAAGVAEVGLLQRVGDPREEIPRLATALGAQAVFANHDDDPYARDRDATVAFALSEAGLAFATQKDHVIFERDEVLTQAGKPYTVFTPYKRAWLERLRQEHLAAHAVAPHAARLAAIPAAAATRKMSLEALGFCASNLAALGITPNAQAGRALLRDFATRMSGYAQARNYPAVKGPSYLSVHLRFGTVSIREAAGLAWARQGDSGAETWLSELIWRDFYHQILFHYPHAVARSFKPAFDRIQWASGAQAKAHFEAWCQGSTGYPLVDAAMHQLNGTGYMHNRLRMVAASFLCKDLGIDWRRGEAYFAQQLIDFDLAANNGGWQWASSSGCDAQPWFRIFNPVRQSETFDPRGAFIRRYLPQLASLSDASVHAPWKAPSTELAAAGLELDRHYPRPIVDHDTARQATLARYAVVKASAVAAGTEDCV